MDDESMEKIELLFKKIDWMHNTYNGKFKYFYDRNEKQDRTIASLEKKNKQYASRIKDLEEALAIMKK